MNNILEKELQNYKIREAYCKEHFPDYSPDSKKDSLENKFIFGVKCTDDTSDEPASFCTVNDLAIYYNRYHEIYYADIDLVQKFSDEGEVISFFKRLLNEFHSYIVTNNISTNDYSLFDDINSFGLSSNTIEGLYKKVEILCNGVINSDIKGIHGYIKKFYC